MVYLGKISYGTYLWHWLVILVVFEAFHISTIATIGIACLVATALAALSFELLEKPVRLSELLDRHRLAVVAAGLALSVVSALVLIPRIVDPVHATAPVLRDSRSADLTPVPASLDLEHTHGVMAYPSCLGKRASACTLVGGSGPSVLLIGDSHASMLIPLFTEIAHLENMRLSASVLLGCPWQLNLTTSYFHKRCQREKADLYTRVIPALKPDIIVLANLDYGTPGPYPAIIEAAVSHATPEMQRRLAALRGSVNVQRIEPSEAMAVIVPPEATYTVPSCPTVGPPSPAMNGTVQRSDPSGLRE